MLLAHYTLRNQIGSQLRNVKDVRKGNWRDAAVRCKARKGDVAEVDDYSRIDWHTVGEAYEAVGVIAVSTRVPEPHIERLRRSTTCHKRLCYARLLLVCSVLGLWR
jgi:hypothetical protein